MKKQGDSMNKQDIYNFLDEKGIEYERTEHKAVFTMDELCDVEIPYPEADAKNLFVRDDKKRNYYLITVRGNKRVNLKEFKQKNGTRNLSFASPEDLMDIMGLVPGSVSPFGILNDKECKVHIFLDKDFTKPPYLIGIHPNENTATVCLKTDDLVNILREHGNTVEFAEI